MSPTHPTMAVARDEIAASSPWGGQRKDETDDNLRLFSHLGTDTVRSPPMGTNGPFTVDTLISRECRTSSDSRRTDDDKRNRRVVTWMVAAGRRRHARRRTTDRPDRAGASRWIAASVGSAHRRRDRHRLPETVLPLRLAPFLGPDPRFRSNRFLGSRIAVRS